MTLGLGEMVSGEVVSLSGGGTDKGPILSMEKRKRMGLV